MEKNKIIKVKVTEEEYNEIKRAAQKKGETVSAYVRPRLKENFSADWIKKSDVQKSLSQIEFLLDKHELKNRGFADAVRKVMEYMSEFFPVTEDMSAAQKKNNIILLNDMKARYFDAPDLQDTGKNGYRFVNAVSDFATHAEPVRKTKNYRENLFLKTAEGSPLIGKAYQMAMSA